MLKGRVRFLLLERGQRRTEGLLAGSRAASREASLHPASPAKRSSHSHTHQSCWDHPEEGFLAPAADLREKRAWKRGRQPFLSPLIIPTPL